MSRIKYLLLVLFLVTGVALSQPAITNYAFTASSGTFTELTGATAPALSGGSNDDGYYNGIPIGFDFWYMGAKYSTMSASTNGWMTFGQNITSAGTTNALATGGNRPVVAPLWDDNDMTSGTFSYLITGTPGSQIFTAEWKNVEWNYSAAGAVISFQVKLYEGTGVVEFIYRGEATAVNSGSASIGITAVATGAGNYLSLDGTGATPNVSSTVETTTLSTKPADGQTYTFTPPAAPSTPTGLVFSGVTTSGMTLEWIDVTGEAGYMIYNSTDGVNYNFVTLNPANDTDYTTSSLNIGTLYYWQIYAVAELASGALSGSMSTLWGTVFGQKWIISGVTATDTFPSFTAAITALNAGLVGPGGVTYKVQPGVTFTEDVPTITASGSSVAPVVFEKDGVGANPIVTPLSLGTKTTTTIAYDGDAVIKIAGGDYITFDGIDVQDVVGGTDNTTRYEYGYLLVKMSGDDACKNITIRNANITLDKATGFSVGIAVSNTDNTGANNITVTSDGGRSEYIYIYSNTISNVYHGIATRGHLTYYDRYIEVGDAGANTITNFGGLSATCFGFYAIYGTDFKVNNNIFNGGAGSTGPLRAIYTSTGTGSSIMIISNDITLQTSATSSGIYAIENTWTGAININGNVIHDINFATATTGVFYGIYNNITSAVIINIMANVVRNNTLTGTGGFYGISGGGAGTNNLNIAGNFVYGNTKTGASGLMYCIQAGTAIVSFASNTIYDNSIPNTSGATAATLYGYYNVGSPTVENYNYNNIYNLTIGGTGTSTSTILYGLYSYTTSTAVKDIYSNNIYSLSTHIGRAEGIRNYFGTTANIYKNKIFNISAGGTASSAIGINLLSNTTNNIYNNFIYDIKAPNANRDSAVFGIKISSTTSGQFFNIYYNSIYLNATSVGANFGSVGIYAHTTPTTDLINNIVFNNSVHAGTGYTVAYRRSSTTLTTYAATSNNNDFYTSLGGLLFFDATNQISNLAAYQTHVAPRDNKSISADPKFLSYSDAIDLHLDPNYMVCNKKGTPITGITGDIDGNDRHPTHPDIGADEYEPNVTPGSIALVSPANNATNVSLFGDLVWNPGTDVDYYDVYLDVNDPPTNKVSPLQTGTTYPYSGLSPATKYFWQIVGWNDTIPGSKIANSSASVVDSFTTATPPNAPTNLAISNIAVNGMDLSWSDNSADEDSFLVYMSLNGIAYNWYAANDANDNTYSATGLNPNARYYWRVTALNNTTGQSDYTAADAWTLAEVPGAPTLTEPLWTSMRVTLALGNNPATTEFVVRVAYNTLTEYVDPATGALSATEVWGTYAAFGGAAGKKVIGLPYATSFTFDVKARNGALVETNYGTSDNRPTLGALSLPFSEDFESPGFPPVGWDTALVYYPGTGTKPVFAKVLYFGDSCVRFNSYTSVSGSSARLWTMPISLSAMPSLSFDFYHSTSYATSFDSLYIQVSTDNGMTWNDVQGFQRYRTTAGWETKTVSLSTYANLTVMLGFLGASKYGSHIYFDDVQVRNYRDVAVSAVTVPPAGTIGGDDITPQVTVLNNGGQDEDFDVVAEIWTAPVGMFEGFEGTAFPPAGWDTLRTGGVATYGWSREVTGTYPTCSPYGGSAMAKLYCFLMLAGNSRRLISPWTSVSGSDQVSFWMTHDNGYATSNDRIVVEVTTDGTTFTPLDSFSRYDVSGFSWQNHTVPLTGYSGLVRVSFHGKSEYGNNIYFDDVTIGTYIPPALVYADTVTVYDLPNMGGFEEAYFDVWTPPASGSYTFKAYTTLAEDMNPANDLMTLNFDVDMTPPDVPTMVAPTDASTTNAFPTFEWEAVTDGEYYNLIVDDGTDAVVIDVNTNGLSYTPLTALDEGAYTWKVRAADVFLNWSDFTDVWNFTVDATPPAIPTPIAPAESSLVVEETQTFVWNYNADAVEYELVVEPYEEPTPPEFSYLTSDTTYETNLVSGVYTYKVRAKDAVGNWSDYSTPIYFTLELPAWVKLADEVEQAPDVKLGKRVKDGGSMIAIGSDFYLFHGNESRYFYMYTPGLDSPFVALESIPDTYKYKYGVGPDPVKIAKNKKIKKGAALCYDGDATIYATKGGGVYEFWAYIMTTETIPHPDPESVQIILPHWEAKAYVPTVKGLKGGTSMAWLDGKLYLFAGSQKSGNPFFFSYDPAGDTALGTPWTTLTPPLLGPFGKVWKDGSAITAMNGYIYALKGKDKYNPLWVYDPIQDTLGGTPWLELEDISLTYPTSMIEKPKKVKVADGGALTNDGSVLYAIKGGGKQDFWMYTPAYDTLPGMWTALCTIPKGPGGKKMVPKTGAALAYANNYVWLMKGNNNAELWRYNVFAKDFVMTRSPRTIASSMVEHTTATSLFSVSVTPNPFTNLAVVRYTIPVTGRVSIKLYNSAGRLSETLLNENLNAGTYTMNLNATTLAKGVYFLKFENEKNTSEVKLIVQ
ncbi:MAG: choice-of-anchor J domain-containing protein [Candidatus Latescibacteria bacterium]|nr:choice-of-anchor J domain-containing protein [Candidatus Latescibacterota bacterium]